jgi:hypothetical protein
MIISNNFNKSAVVEQRRVFFEERIKTTRFHAMVRFQVPVGLDTTALVE